MRRTPRHGAPRCGRGSKEEAERFGAWLVFADETGASTAAPVRRTWGRRGRTPLVALSRKRGQRLSASGWLCVNPADGRVRLVYTAQRRSVTRHDLPRLIHRVHDQLRAPMVLVWDNHASHTARSVNRELEQCPWLSVVALPAYAPELNPVETLWSHLKAHLANRAFRSVDELEGVMRSRLRSVQRKPELLRGFIRSVGLDPCPIPSSP